MSLNAAIASLQNHRPLPWGSQPGVRCVANPKGSFQLIAGRGGQQQSDLLCYPETSNYWASCLSSPQTSFLDVERGVLACSNGDLWRFPSPSKGGGPLTEDVLRHPESRLAFFPRSAADIDPSRRSVPVSLVLLDGRTKVTEEVLAPTPAFNPMALKEVFDPIQSECLRQQLEGGVQSLGPLEPGKGCGESLVTLGPATARGFTFDPTDTLRYVIAQPADRRYLAAWGNQIPLAIGSLKYSLPPT